jgi:hypothetical protein
MISLPLRFTLIAFGLVGIALGVLWVSQRRIIYLPTAGPGPPPHGWEEVSTTTDDDLVLSGWYHPAREERPIVIVFHGNAGNRADRMELGSSLAQTGFGVVMFDFRGYGGNPGSPTEDGLSRDARAMADWVSQRDPDSRVIYLGESLGSAVAVALATERSPDALLLRSPFTSLGDVAAVHYPIIPVRQLLWDQYRAIEHILDVDAPVTVVAGSADGTVPPSQSLAIYEAAPNAAEWVLIDGADHNDAQLSHGPMLIEALERLIGEDSG